MARGVYDNARRKAWTPAEAMKVEDWLSEGLSVAQISRRLGRSENSVKVWTGRNVKIKATRPMTARRVADILGVPCSKTVAWWIGEGWLAARKGQRVARGRMWIVTEEALFAFLGDCAHWHRWEPERITEWTIREWATELRGDVRFLTQTDVAARYHVVRGTVQRWIDDGYLPAIDHGSHRMIEASALVGFVIPSERDRHGRPRQPFTAIEDARLLALRASGAAWAECAYQLHRPLGSCAGRWERLQRVPKVAVG